MHADFTNPLADKAARLTDGVRALGTVIAKRLEAWLLAWAHPVPAGFMPVCLRPGWAWGAVMPPAPSAGARSLLHLVAAPLGRACPEGPSARPRTLGRRAAFRPATLRPSRLKGRRAPLETRDRNRVAETGWARPGRLEPLTHGAVYHRVLSQTRPGGGA